MLGSAVLDTGQTWGIALDAGRVAVGARTDGYGDPRERVCAREALKEEDRRNKRGERKMGEQKAISKQ